MAIGRRAVALCSAAVLASSGTLLAQQVRKLSDAQRREVQEIVKIVDSAAAAPTAPNDLSLTWAREDFLKAQGNQQYVPFTVMIDPSKVSGNNVTIYWRVVAKTAAPAAAAAAPPAPARGDENKAPAKPEYAYEDISTAALSSKTGPVPISRSFAVAAGSYEVTVVVKEPTPQKQQRNAPPLKISMLKQNVEVPDLWNGELNTSTVFLAQRIDPLPAPLTPQQQVERPYALGTMEIVPVADTKFTKKSELSTLVLIYNVKTDATNKPDVTVEYNFYTKQGTGEKFFNKTNPQSLNAQTLPPQFDFAAGHQLQSGQAVPLTSFPEGDYRLEIKITDKLAAKSLVRNVNFTVVGG
jgi:hypothetical protein